MQGTTNKPAAATGQITSRTQEQLEEARSAAQKKAAEDTIRLNKVAALIGNVRYWIENHSFPFLVYKGTPLSVTEFYPDTKVAVDRFYNVEDHDPAITDFKRKAFKKNGIRYGFLTPEKSLADLHEELDL